MSVQRVLITAVRMQYVGTPMAAMTVPAYLVMTVGKTSLSAQV